MATEEPVVGLTPEDIEAVKQKERALINWFVSLNAADKSAIQGAFGAGPNLEKELAEAENERNDYKIQLDEALAKIEELEDELELLKVFSAEAQTKYDEQNYELKGVIDERDGLKAEYYDNVELLYKSKHTYNNLLIRYGVMSFELDRAYMKIKGDTNKIYKNDTIESPFRTNKRRQLRSNNSSANNSVVRKPVINREDILKADPHSGSKEGGTPDARRRILRKKNTIG